MTEQENFLRVAIIVVDHAKESFIELLDVHLSNVGLTFEQFINQNQHEIFHLFNNTRCCKCHTRNTSRNSRVIFAPQMSILFDKATQCNAGRCLDFCCCSARTCLATKDLDMTLAKCLLINFCSEVFWYASLNFLGQTLEQFLNIHKHDIYHMWQNSVSCCECDPTTPTPIRRGFLNSLQWNHMFKSTSIPCVNHRKRPASGTVNCICSMKSITGISLAQIDAYTQDVLIKQCCMVRKAIDSLTSIRNERYGHISEGRISNNEYHSLNTEIERGILEIAKVCKKERDFEAKLKMAKTHTLSMDYVTNEKYKQKMLEVLSNSVEIEMHLTNQDSTLEAIRGKAKRIPTEIVSKIPKIVDESTQHISRTVQENFAYQREMVEKYGNKLRQYCDLTLMDIKSHWSEGTFVETEEVRRCVKGIQENDAIIIYGRTGSGKTRTGLEILRQLGELDQSYHLVKILDIQQVNDVLMTGVNIAILLDDLFCFEFESREGLVWNSVFDRLYSCKMNICIKIICTVKTSFKKSISQYFQSKRIFLNRFEIDLESASLSIAEKSEILSRFCNRFEIDVEWNIPSENKRQKLDRKIFFEIVKYETFLPLATSYFLFTSESKNFCLGLSFFKHPPEYLIESINTLRDAEGVLVSQIKYSILVLILIKGHLARNSPEDLNRLSKFLSECFNVSSNKTLKIKMEKAIDELDEEYLQHDDHSPMYTFKHRMVTEAVSVSYFDIDPEVVISVIDVDFMVEMVRLLNDTKSTPKLGIGLTEDLYDLFCEKLFDQYSSCSRTKQRDTVKRFCTSKLIQTNNMEFVGSVVRVTQRYNDIENDSGNKRDLPVIFLLDMIEFSSRKIDATDVVKVLLDGLKMSPKFQNSLAIIGSSIESTLQYLCESENHGSTFDIIVEFTKDSKLTIDFVQCLFAAVETDNKIRFNALIKEFRGKFTYVDLVHESDAQILPSLVNLLSKTFLGYPCDSFNKTTIVQWLMSQPEEKLINYQHEADAACKKHLKEVVDWMVQNRSMKLDCPSSIVDQSCLHVWESVLITLLAKCDPRELNLTLVYHTACRNNLTMLLKHLSNFKSFLNVDFMNTLTELYRLKKHEAIRILITDYDINLHDLIDLFSELVNLFGPDSFDRIISSTLRDHNLMVTPLRLALLLHIETNCHFHNHVDNILTRINEDQQLTDSIFRWLFGLTSTDDKVKHLLKRACALTLMNICKWFLLFPSLSEKEVIGLLEEACISENVDIVKIIINYSKHTNQNLEFVITAETNNACQDEQEFLLWILHSDISMDAKVEIPSKLSLYLSNIGKRSFTISNNIEGLVEQKNERLLFELLTFVQPRELTCLALRDFLLPKGYPEDFIVILQWIQNTVSLNRFPELSALFRLACSDHRTDVVNWMFSNTDKICLKLTVTDIIYGASHFFFDVNAALRVVFENNDDEWSLENIQMLMESDVVSTFNDSIGYLLQKACAQSQIDIVKIILENIDHTIFDINEVVQGVYRCKDDKTSYELIKLLLSLTDISNADVKIIMNEACRRCHTDVVKILLDKADHSFFDVDEAVTCVYENEMSCQESPLVIQLLLSSIDISKFNVKFIMNKSCSRGERDVVKTLLDKADYSLFDVTEVVIFIYNNSFEDSSSLVQRMLTTVDISNFDVKFILNEACRRGQTDVVKILLDKADNSLFDVHTAVACVYGNNLNSLESSKIIISMLSYIDISKFDVRIIMNEACRRCQTDVVKTLLDKADTSLFNVDEAVVCVYKNEIDCQESSSIIKQILSSINISKLNVKFIMNKACSRGERDVVKILLDKADYSLFDVTEVVMFIYNNSFEDSSSLVQRMLTTVDISNFDVKFILNEACRRGQTDVVKIILEKGDHSLLNVDEAVACAYANNIYCKEFSSVVILMLTYIDITKFDVKVIMNEACWRYETDVIKILLDKADPSLIDVKMAAQRLYWADDDDSHKNESSFIVQLMLSTFNILDFDVKFIFNEACKRCQADVVEIILDKAGNSLLLNNLDITRFDVEYIMNETCRKCLPSVLKMLLDKVDHSLFNVNKALQCIYNDANDDSKTSSLIQCLLSRIDISRFDVEYIMKEACKRCQLNVVGMLLDKADHSVIDFNEVVRCIYYDNDYDEDSKTSSLIQVLLSRIDISRFDVQYIMKEACKKCQPDVVGMLLDRADHSLLDVNEVVRCIYEDSKTSSLIQVLLSRIDISRFDVQYIMKEACKTYQPDVVGMLLDRADHSLLDVNEVVRCIYEDSKTSSLIQVLLSRIDISRFDVQYIMKEACKKCQPDVVGMLLDRADHSLLDVNEVVRCIYKDSKTSSLIQVLLSRIDISRFDVQYIMKEACKTCQPDVVGMLLDRADHSLLDVNEVVRCIYEDSKTSSLIQVLLSRIDISRFDVKYIMKKACKRCQLDVVKILLDKADHSLLDVNKVVRFIYYYYVDDCVDDSKTSSLIQVLLSRIDISRFDIKYIMDEACERCQPDVVGMLLDRADHSLLNVNEVVRCIYYNYYDDEYDDDSKTSSLIQVLLSRIDISRFDVKYIMDEACERCQPDVVKILLDKADHSLFNVNRAVKLVYNNSYCDQKKAFLIIDLLLSEFDISVFDAKFLMNESCRRCHNEVVEILLSKKFPDLNMQSAVINLCRGDNLKGLNYVLNEYPESKYDLDKCLIVACRYGSIDVAKWLMATEQFSEVCLITALRNASRCGRIRVVKLLVDNSVFTLNNTQEAITDALKSDYDSIKTREVYFYLVNLRKSQFDLDVLFTDACKSCRLDIIDVFVREYSINFRTAFAAVLNIPSGIKYTYDDDEDMYNVQDILITIIEKGNFQSDELKEIFVQLSSKGCTKVLDHLVKPFGKSNLEQIAQSTLTTASNNGQLETVNWILNKIDKNLLDLKDLIIDACAYGWICIIERYKHILKTNINEYIVEACNFKRLDILRWILKNMECNRLEIDVQYVLLTSCTNGWEEIYDWIMVNKCNKRLPLDECVTQACIHGHVTLVEKLFKSFGSQYFNLNLIYNSILSDKRNGDVLNFLLTTFGHQILNIQDVLMAACQFGWLPVAEFVFRDLSKMEDSDEILNVPLAFRLACDNGESDIVKLFLAQLPIDDNDVNLKYAMETSCEKGWDEIVSALFAMVDQQKLNVTDCLLKACESGESEVVDIILKNGNIDILTKGQCMKKAITCHMNEQTTLVILKSCDETNFDFDFDIEEVKTKARVYRWTAVLSFFNEEISDDYLEMIVD